MKKYFRIYFILLLFTAFTAVAGSTDSQGFPVFYLRGEMEGTGWNVDSRFRFDRSGSDYTLSLDELDGEFKISNDDWSINFGNRGDKYAIEGPQTVEGVQSGANFIARNLSGVTISFTYTAGEPAMITISTSGKIPQLSGTLPVLYINVKKADGTFDNEIISKDLAHKNYFDGEYRLDLNGCEWMAAEGAESIGSPDEFLPLEIKARGNYTRTAFAKKPFKIKLASKQAMLGLTKSKHFALLAHADDNYGYLRNFCGFNLGRRIGLPWTPWQQPVELVINGDYRGLYFLTESIRVDSKRVDIEELDDNVSDPALISGGYLVELDNYDEENQIRLDEKGQAPGHKDKLRITFDTPEILSELQRRFLTDQFTAINNLIGDNSDEVWSYVDLDDAARYYIVEEIISHVEAYHGSTYLFRDRGEGRKWHFSPLWDCGNAFRGPTDDFFYRHAPYGATWIPSLRLNDKFNDKVRQTWLWFMSNEFEGFYDDIDTYVDHISQAARSDRRRWAKAPAPNGGNGVSDNSDMASRRNEVVRHLNEKIKWLRRTFGDYTAATTPEPERDNTEAAPLPDYAKTGIEEIELPEADGNVEFYNLQGIPVTKPQSGNLYIIRRGSRSYKSIVR